MRDEREFRRPWLFAILRPGSAGPEALGIVVRPPLQLDERDEPKLALADELQLRLDMALERIERHPQRDRRLLATECDTRNVGRVDVPTSVKITQLR